MASPVTEAAASASDLVVRRQGHVILDGLTFSIPRGRVSGLLGPSGCGKTTLMRTLVGVQVIDAGRVELLGLPRSRLAEAIAQTVAILDLGGLERRLVGTFSGGQLARADLAVALLAEPDLLVLDEPTVGLDPVLRRDLWAMFHRLAAGGTTLLVSSHVMDEAARCDHLLFMREGRFLAAASTADMLAATGAADLESAFLALAGQPQAVRP